MSKIEEKNKKQYLIFSSLTLLSILFFASLVSHKTGIVGELIRKFLFSILGFGGYTIPFFMIYSNIVLYKKKESSIKNLIYLLILFLCLLIVMDIINNGNINSMNIRINENIELAKEGLGSGIVGGFLGFLFLKLFGTVGTYLILSLVIVISTFHFTKIDFKKILVLLKNRIKLVINNYRNNPNKFNLKEFVNNLKSKFNKSKEIPLIEEFDIENDEEIKEEIFETVNLKENIESEIIISDYSDNMDIIDIDDDIEINIINDDIEEIDIPIENKYIFPNTDLLNKVKKNNKIDNKQNLEQARQIEKTMKDFNIDAKVTKINRGPTITCYELEPAPGVKISKILGLSDNLSLALATSDIRIEAPIPGKAAIGIEVPNIVKDSVSLREILEDPKFINDNNNLPLVLGKDISGEPIISSIDKMPHLLIAGATGSGKSVCINTIITSILYKSDPKEVKLLLIDPKVVELSIYNDIPHLLLPVVTSPKDARFALKWAVDEMERRYKIFAENNVRDIKSYNNIKDKEYLSKIIIIIDELSDLMMVSAQEIEDYICRLAQMARAAGIYLIIATQRPSVDVITGIIKANIPSRISFSVSSQIDSRTILDMGGAEKLLGKGDMLFYPSDYAKPKRIQGAFITDEEVFRIVSFIKENHKSNYDKNVIDNIKENKEINKLGPKDDLFDEALELVINQGEASISMLQRRLKIGYNRAANIIDLMYDNGYVGEQEGNKPRTVLINKNDLNTDKEES